MLKNVFPLLILLPTVAIAQSYVVYDFTHNKVLESGAPNTVRPIASVTKLMTANVFLEHNKNPRCTASITDDDFDYIKGTHTKLPKYTPISCRELLKMMLVHSDNYAAHALSRSAGMTRLQFIGKMNEKARQLGMKSTRFSDSSGLSNHNVSSVMDLVKLTKYSMKKTEIKAFSNISSTYVKAGKRNMFVKNTNKLVRDEMFSAAINKTGYIRESGYNLVFVNKVPCNNRATIGVISLNNSSSAYRSSFTKNKLEKYGCTALNSKVLRDFVDDMQYEEGYDKAGMDELIRKVAG
ncbi:D-alanyl-D-alanine carboxypeptidase family protein [Aggregatibacter actinomycetemcomitans]|uniref:D-alanyl-D-alanine carboxypeptidase family protein n=1 Tax=Aggregatibacter actinomycetemcomitans TaxID=714 RepID=UPI0011DD8EFD|nr:serine hydrolase [Aggregatibacter actinomycetemcomitans]QEH45671.1 D-alanyl-D-alanine carboxypeptidase [Aggregatibacter actinomycetemcomitans]QEH49403.1 D-alanyl-D-alanine carboxypeptidase [Aggregatibacter actinomycetemcomitans]